MELERYDQLLRATRYVMLMRPVFNTRALFSDETENYVSPMEPKPGDTVTIRFRTGRDNVDVVYFICKALRKRMRLERSDNRFDYYAVEYRLGTEPIHYYFEVKVSNFRCFYNKCGISTDLQDSKAFTITPGFSTPDWAKGAVMYQIYIDRFCNGDPSNDVLDREYSYIGEPVSRVVDWNKCPAFMGVREFYGGDLQGVMNKLDYLQDLGVDVIYFNPLFVSPSNHKYDIQDYDYIDPHLGKIVKDSGEVLPEGCLDNTRATRYITRVTDRENLYATNEFFIRLVKEIHRRGMKIILDGVFNHCGSFNKWMDRERIYERQPGYEKGAYISEDSPYSSFFKFYNEHEWPYNEFYDGWWNYNTLPKLNFEESPDLEEYIMEIARKWVSPPYNVDGWRLDVAADLGFSPEYNHRFWKRFRKVVKQANPNAVILAEHYGDATPWLRGDEWDTVMNYDAFMEPLTWFFTGMEKHSDSFRQDQLGNAQSFIGAMTYHMASFLAPSLQTAMNQLSNHDHSRFLTRTNHKTGRVQQLGYEAASEGVNEAVMREAVIMQMTWPGAPTLYYGDEAGVCGFTDPDNRRTYPWGKENKHLLGFYREAIRMHKLYPVFSKGSLKFLHGSQDCLAYGRFDDQEKIAVVFNNGYQERTLSIPVWEIGVGSGERMERIMLTDEEGFSLQRQTAEAENGELAITLSATSAAVYRWSGKK